MKRFFYWGCIVLLIAIFFAIVIYLPEMDAGILERQYVNQYTLVKQDKQEQGIHYELPLVDKLLSLYYGEFSTEIMSIHSIANLESQDEALLEGLQSQISILEKAEIIPELVDLEHLRKSFHEALYYNISNVENPSAVVSAWKLTFYDAENFRYQFVIDASTYKIYSADIYGYTVYDFWLKKGIYTAHVEKAGSEKLWELEDKMRERLSGYYEAGDSKNVYLSLEGNFVFEGVLFYEGTQNDKKYTTDIPLYIYYYPESKDSMEGMHIGIENVLEDRKVMQYDNAIETYAD